MYMEYSWAPEDEFQCLHCDHLTFFVAPALWQNVNLFPLLSDSVFKSKSYAAHTCCCFSFLNFYCQSGAKGVGCNSFTRSSVSVCYWEYDTHVIVHIDLARWVTSSICGEMTAGWYQTGDASSALVTMHRPLCKISCKIIQIRHNQRAWQSLFLEGMNFKSTDD